MASYWAFTDSTAATAAQQEVFSQLPPDTTVSGAAAPVQYTTAWDVIRTLGDGRKYFTTKSGIVVPVGVGFTGDGANWTPYRSFEERTAGWDIRHVEDFSNLSIRRGGYYSGENTGYKDPSSKGTWSFCGISYMNRAEGFDNFNSWDYLINPLFAGWQSIDQQFSRFGLAELTSRGLTLSSTSAYPLIRAACPTQRNKLPHLSTCLTNGQSLKATIPFAIRSYLTVDVAGPEDFHADWLLGQKSNGSVTHTKHQEFDTYESYGSDYGPRICSQTTHLFADDFHAGCHFDSGVTLRGGAQFEIATDFPGDGYVYYFCNGVLTLKQLLPPGFDATDGWFQILNSAVNPTWRSYVADIGYTASITWRRIEVLAPSSNTTLTVPEASPTPVTSWQSGFAGGVMPSAAPNGSVLAVLSGASSHTLIPRLINTLSGLSVVGSTLQKTGSISPGSYDFYIEGVNAAGVPGLAPKMTLTVT